MAAILQRARTEPSDAGRIKAALRERARALGFDAVGFAAPDLPRGVQDAYRHYLAEGRQGDMAWLARDPGRRADPSRSLAGRPQRDRARNELWLGRSPACGARPA